MYPARVQWHNIWNLCLNALVQKNKEKRKTTIRQNTGSRRGDTRID